MFRRALLFALLAAASCGGDDEVSSWPQSVVYVEFMDGQLDYRLVRATTDGHLRAVIWDNDSSGSVPTLLRPSPSGGTILLFLDSNGFGGSSGWFTLPVGGGRLSPFTAPLNAVLPQWSPDGSALVWLLNETYRHRLTVATAGSILATPLTPDSLWVLPYYAWSPDGSTLAFCAGPNGGGSTKVYTVPSTGGEVHAVSQDPSASDCSPTWAPDGQHLAWIRNLEEIVIAAPDGSAPRHLAYAGVSEGLYWSPDGTELLTTVTQAQRMSRFVVATGDELPTNQFGPAYPTSPWSPDGTMLISFGRTEPDSLGHTGPTILVGNLSGSQLVQVSSATHYGSQPAWLPPTE